MHPHTHCEQQIAAATRTGNTGRAEYLAARCDREHGDLTAPTDTRTHVTWKPSTTPSST